MLVQKFFLKPLKLAEAFSEVKITLLRLLVCKMRVFVLPFVFTVFLENTVLGKKLARRLLL